MPATVSSEVLSLFFYSLVLVVTLPCKLFHVYSCNSFFLSISFLVGSFSKHPLLPCKIGYLNSNIGLGVIEVISKNYRSFNKNCTFRTLKLFSLWFPALSPRAITKWVLNSCVGKNKCAICKNRLLPTLSFTKLFLIA